MVGCRSLVVLCALLFAACSSTTDNGNKTYTPSDGRTGGDDYRPGDTNGGGDTVAGDDDVIITGWNCDASYYGTNDGCDCGCGKLDPDCDQGCAEPGCYGASCRYCYDEAGEDTSCPPPPVPATWTCDAAMWGDETCDCGCGAADYDCGCAADDVECNAGICTAAGCKADSCELCHNGASVISCAPDGWLCSQAEWQDSDCDCGCGLEDGSCDTGSCTTPGCKANVCEICHDSAAAVVSCAPTGWTCTEEEWGDYSCDCGCGVEDKDCDAGSCKDPGCTAKVCEVCHNGANTQSCMPTTYTCGQDAYDDWDCDCGCGAEDRACDAGSCFAPGCLAQVCDICHGATDDSCVPPTWTCDPTKWGDWYCDCGCGVEDHDCGAGSCTAAGCTANACDICNNGGTEVSCAPRDWVCNASDWKDAYCDCGCGAADADCTEGGCTAPGCTDAACDYCWGGEGNTGLCQ